MFAILARTQAAVASDTDAPVLENNLANGDAHIVVQYAPTDQVVRSIQITNPISGLLALQSTGLEVVTHDFGGGFIAVCAINGVGCPADDCFCSSKFWNYEYWDGSNWQGYLVGPTDSSVEAGDMEGWRLAEFGVGGFQPGTAFQAADLGLDWLASQMPISGTYGNASSNVETLLSIGANDLAAGDWRAAPDSVSLMGRMLVDGPGYTHQGAGQAGKFAVGLIAADGCWPYGAVEPSTFYSTTTGQYAEGAGLHSWAILGTLALSETVPAEALQYLRDLVQPNGGWEWSPGMGADTNSTSLAIQALTAAGESPTSTLILNGLNFLKTAQNEDGGFTYDPNSPFGTDSDTNSTAYVVQAIRAAGQDPITGTWTISSTNPISYLLGMQLPDGSFEWQPGFGSNGLATQQAIPALLGRVFPFESEIARACPVVFMPILIKNSP
jgi:hypothetical protein